MSEQDITKLGIIQIVNEKLYNTQTEGEKIPHLFGTLDRRLVYIYIYIYIYIGYIRKERSM